MLRVGCRQLLAFLFIIFLVGFVLSFLINHANDDLNDLNSTGDDSIDTSWDLSKTNGKESQDWAHLNLPVGRARFDRKRILRIYDFVRVGNKWENLIDEFDICLTTQTSIERIHWLPQVLEHWNGPLSIAVFLSNEEEWIVLNLYMEFLTRCSTNFRDHVSIHAAVPVYIGAFSVDETKVSGYNMRNLRKESRERSCRDAEGYLNYLLKGFSIPTSKDKDKLAMKLIYPQNHMRNIARKTCATHWTLSTDVDIIPRPGMAEMLQEFYKATNKDSKICRKCAFVIPTFELHESQPFPKTKNELVSQFEKGYARQYHKQDYDQAQRATNYQVWTTTNVDEGPVKVSHKIMHGERNTRFYEPFYISSDKIPAFDERFLGYGLTRSSQFQEALLGGWNFTVLTPVYSIHWGLHEAPPSKKEESIAEKVRNKQTKDNRYLFAKIAKEMKLKAREGIL